MYHIIERKEYCIKPMPYWDLQSSQSSCCTDIFAKYDKKSSVSRKICIKTVKYILSLGPVFPNKPKILKHKKLSVGNDKKVAFIPRSAMPKRPLFLTRLYEENTTTTSLTNLQKKRTGKKKGGHCILDSYIIPMKISSSSTTVWVFHKITESQNYTMFAVESELWRFSSPTPDESWLS